MTGVGQGIPEFLPVACLPVGRRLWDDAGKQQLLK